jgi:hypothetical protein
MQRLLRASNFFSFAQIGRIPLFGTLGPMLAISLATAGLRQPGRRSGTEEQGSTGFIKG